MTRDLVYRAALVMGRGALGALDLTVRSCGQQHVPAHGPVVLAINHVSFPDFVFVQQALLPATTRAPAAGRLVRFMCRHEIWHGPLAAAMDAMRHIPVDRRAPAAAYLAGRRLLGEGEVVGVFPEGGISAAYVVRSLMPGAVALARETRAPLVPVVVWGGQRLWPQRRNTDEPFPRPQPRRGRLVDVRFLPGLSVAPDADVVAVTRELGGRLQAALESLQRLREHRPRPGEWAPWHPAHLAGAGLTPQAAAALDRMPRSAITPTWTPGADPGRRPG